MGGETGSIRRLAGVAAAYSIADGLIRGMGFLLLPLLVLHLGTDGFGIFGALTALATLLTHLFGFGLSGVPIRYYHRFDDPTERRAFLGSTLAASATLAVLGSALLHAFTPGALDAVGLDRSLVIPVRLTIWTAWLQVVARTLPLGILRARQSTGRYLLVSAAAVVSTLALVYWRVAVRDEGLLGVVRGTFEGAFVTMTVALGVVTRDLAIAWNRQHILIAFTFGLPLTPHNLAHWVLGLSDRFLVGRLLGTHALGIYHFAYQFASIFQLLISAINTALLPKFARLDPAAPAGVGELRRLVALYLCTAMLTGTALVVLIPPLVVHFLPEVYEPALVYLPWLIASVALFAAYSIPMNVLTMTLGRTERIAGITLLAGAVNVTLNLALLRMIGLWGAVAATGVSYLVLYLGARRLANRHSHLVGALVSTGPLGAIATTCTVTSVLASILEPPTFALDVLFGTGMLGATAVVAALVLNVPMRSQPSA